MSTAVHRSSTPSLSIPPSQNTAPVLEFNCLYTHDIRRKQKRWQDGFLRFHTFNKRVMVYDVPRNFVGDVHWKADEAVQEGDEVTLEREAVLVQVAEAVGRTETDLTELKQSARKGRRGEGGEGSSPARAVATPSKLMGPPPARLAVGSTAGGNTQLKHRSLNALLGTPKGRIGKASVPVKSPFEMRQAAENEEWESGRPPKRPREDPWVVTRTTTTPKPDANKETPLRKRTADARAKAARRGSLPSCQRRLGTKEVIDLSDDGDESPSKLLPVYSSDAAGPGSSPVREISGPVPSTRKEPVRSSSPAFQVQASKSKEKRTDAEHQRPNGRAEERRQDAGERRPAAAAAPLAPPSLPTSTKASQTLRMATGGPKRRTLACLDDNSSSPANVSDQTMAAENAKAPASKRKTQRELLEERLAKMRRLAQQKADDLNDVINDAEATASELHTIDSAPMSNKDATRADAAEPEMLEKPTRASAPRHEAIIDRPAPRAPNVSVHRTPSPAAQTAGRTETVLQDSIEPNGVPQPANSADTGSAGPAMPDATTAAIERMEVEPRHSTKEPSPPPPPKEPSPKQARRRPGIGRREIRKSAQNCFPTALDLATDGTSTVMLSKPFSAPKPPSEPKPAPRVAVPDPWTREAFDLFTWRPPGWDEEKWCVSGNDNNVAS